MGYVQATYLHVSCISDPPPPLPKYRSNCRVDLQRIALPPEHRGTVLGTDETVKELAGSDDC